MVYYYDGNVLLGRPKLVPEGFMFHNRCFLFLSPRDLRPASADRRETLPTLTQFYNASPKIRGAKNMQYFGRFCTTSDFRDYLQNAIRYPKSERHATENDSSCIRRNKSGELWSTIQKVGHVSLDPPKSTFSGDYSVSQKKIPPPPEGS